MMSKTWQPVRIVLLAGLLGSTLWVLGRAIASPPAQKTAQPTYSLPDVALQGWELQTSSPLKPTPDFPTGRQYQYRRQNTNLNIQARLMVSDGNISRLLFVYTPIKSANVNLQTRHYEGIGYYGVVAYQGQAYLSACVNSRGESTVTEPQFMQNRYKHDLQVTRLLPWMLGQEPLLDQRCLWTLMATPLPADAKTNPAATEATFKTLETSWFFWQQWWSSRFPAPSNSVN